MPRSWATSENGDLYRLRNDDSGMCPVVRGTAEGARAVRGGADGDPAVQTGGGGWSDQVWNYW